MKKNVTSVLSVILVIFTLFSSMPVVYAGGPVNNQTKGYNSPYYFNSLTISSYYGSMNSCTNVPFYNASATSELKENAILFQAAYTIDETINRPWVEGVRGDGSGESLTLYFRDTESVDVLSLRLGYARDSKRYYANNRPKTLHFEFSDGSWADYVFSDLNQEQTIQLSRTVETRYVKMTILDVYKGDCSDTCIYLVKAYQFNSSTGSAWNANSLKLYSFNDPNRYYYQVPFYNASATSELEENDILFQAAYAIDETINRPWVEGVRGDGSGESLTLYFRDTESVDVLSLRLGYARDSKRYYANNRPKTLRFEFSDGSLADYVFSDLNQEQTIQLSRTVETRYVKMTILDVYKGDCSDTCIYLVKAYCA